MPDAVPQMYDANLSEESHLIILTDENGERVVVLFFLKGVTSHHRTQIVCILVGHVN